MTTKQLNNLNHFWKQYLANYNNEYSEKTLNLIADNNDITAFLHPEDLEYFKSQFGNDFTIIPRFEKMINFANNKIFVDKQRHNILLKDKPINPMIPQPYFGNPKKADIIILNKQPENDFRTDNPLVDGERKIRLRNRILQDLRGNELGFDEKKFLPYEDQHIWFMKYFYSESSILKQFNIDPNRLMLFNYFPYQTSYQAGVPKEFLTLSGHTLPSQRKIGELFANMVRDGRKRIFIVREEEFWTSNFIKVFTPEECQMLIDNMFVFASKQNKYLTLGNILSYREQLEKLKQKRTLSKSDFYKWKQHLKEDRLMGKSDIYQALNNF